MAQPNPTPASASFRLADGLGYALQQDHLSVIRLNLQHFLWRQVFGFDIHPRIPIPPTKNGENGCHDAAACHIADVACGTALWLIDVARSLPLSSTIHLDGLDIDLTQAPHAGWLPPTITLHHWDLFTEVPGPWHERYDLVHLRLLVLVLSGVDLPPVIRRVFQLVQPGGWVQWDELDCVNMCVKRAATTTTADSPTATTAAPAPATEALREACYAGGRHDWVVQALPTLLTEAGFVDVRLERFDEPPELVRAFSDQHLLTMEEFAARLAGQGKMEAAGRFRTLVSEAYREGIVQGVALSIPRVVFVGRRPCAL